MTTLDISPSKSVWRASDPEAWTPPAITHDRLERLLPALTGVCLVVVDLALVMGAFMAAHWLRFVAADDSLSALGIEQYVLMSLLVAGITSGLFAFRGLYDEPRPYAWPTRLYTIVSAVST